MSLCGCSFPHISPAMNWQVEYDGIIHPSSMGGEPTYHVMDPGLPYQPPMVCEDSGLCVGHSCLQYGGPTGNSPGPVLLHFLYCRLLPSLTPLPSAKILWWLCNGLPHQGQGRQNLKRTYQRFCGMVSVKLPTNQYREAKGRHPGNGYIVVTPYLGAHLNNK